MHSPNHHLQQLDLFYVDEPAPFAEELDVIPGAGDAAARLWDVQRTGVALGVWLLTLVELLRGGTTRRGIVAAGFVGHAYSIVPDVLFLGAGILHYLWMDVFALHFIPAPLVTILLVYALAIFGWGCAVTDRRIAAVLALAAAVITTAGALALRAPLPTSLSEIRDTRGIALVCPLPELATTTPP